MRSHLHDVLCMPAFSCSRVATSGGFFLWVILTEGGWLVVVGGEGGGGKDPWVRCT